jgi:hypothetical protein
MNKRHLLIAAMIVVALIFWLWWRSTGVQVPATFERIAEAVNKGDAAKLLRQLHPDYDIAKRWPDQLGEISDAQAERLNLKPLILHGLMSFFQMRANDPISMTYTLGEITKQEDGTIAVLASIAFQTKSGGQLTIEPPIENNKFILKRDGAVSAALYVVGHDPIRYVHE